MNREIVLSREATDAKHCEATIVFSREATAANSRGGQPTEHGANRLFEPRSGGRFSRISHLSAAASRLEFTRAAHSAGLRPQLIAGIASRLEDVTSPASQPRFRSDR